MNSDGFNNSSLDQCQGVPPHEKGGLCFETRPGSREADISEPSPPAEPSLIEIRVEKLAQLFHSLDPLPFREKDLDKDAEEFIVSWARELPRDQSFKIVVHVPEEQLALPEAA